MERKNGGISVLLLIFDICSDNRHVSLKFHETNRGPIKKVIVNRLQMMLRLKTNNAIECKRVFCH